MSDFSRMSINIYTIIKSPSPGHQQSSPNSGVPPQPFQVILGGLSRLPQVHFLEMPPEDGQEHQRESDFEANNKSVPWRCFEKKLQVAVSGLQEEIFDFQDRSHWKYWKLRVILAKFKIWKKTSTRVGSQLELSKKITKSPTKRFFSRKTRKTVVLYTSTCFSLYEGYAPSRCRWH